MSADSDTVLPGCGLAEGIVPHSNVIVPRAFRQLESEDVERAFVHRRQLDRNAWIGQSRVLAVTDNGFHRLSGQIARTSRLDLRNRGYHLLERRPVQPDHILPFRVPVRQRHAINPLRILNLFIIGQVVMHLHQNDVQRRERHRHPQNVQHPRKRCPQFSFSEYAHITYTFNISVSLRVFYPRTRKIDKPLLCQKI